jgi:hypothetical protein
VNICHSDELLHIPILWANYTVLHPWDSTLQAVTTIILGVHFAGSLDVQNILSADTGICRQTEGHSFGDDLVSGSVNVTPSSVIEPSIVLCYVSL